MCVGGWLLATICPSLKLKSSKRPTKQVVLCNWFWKVPFVSMKFQLFFLSKHISLLSTIKNFIQVNVFNINCKQTILKLIFPRISLQRNDWDYHVLCNLQYHESAIPQMLNLLKTSPISKNSPFQTSPNPRPSYLQMACSARQFPK